MNTQITTYVHHNRFGRCELISDDGGVCTLRIPVGDGGVFKRVHKRCLDAGKTSVVHDSTRMVNYSRRKRASLNGDSLERVLDFVQRGNGVTTSEIASGIGKNIMTIKKCCGILEQKGLICKGAVKSFSQISGLENPKLVTGWIYES